MVVLGAVCQRDRPHQADAEAGVAQQALAVEHDLDDHVGASLLAARGGVADPSQVPSDLVAQPFEGGGEDRAVLEAVAAAAPADELLLDGVEGDAGVLAEQHVDVVEREGAHVRLVQLGERCAAGGAHGGGVDVEAGQVAVEVERVDLPVVGRHPIGGRVHPGNSRTPARSGSSSPPGPGRRCAVDPVTRRRHGPYRARVRRRCPPAHPAAAIDDAG